MDNSSWIEGRIEELEKDFLHKIFECRSPQAVEAAVTYARFLGSIGVNPENCTVAHRLLEVDNRWVTEALVGKQDPFAMLSVVQPSNALVEHIFETLRRWHRGSVHSMSLAALLGLLRSVYASPGDGYRLYPLQLSDLNALGKHLDKKKGQDDPVNRAILDILDKLSDLSGEEAVERLAVQSTTIRNAFFDDRRRMADVIPEVTLEAGEESEEIAPRKSKPPAPATRQAGGKQ